MAKGPLSIVWFRQDLRIGDNPALLAAAAKGRILPIYILDDENAGNWRMGGASRVWLHYALKDLNKSLNGKLSLFRGPAEEVLAKLADRLDIEGIFWDRCYEPWRVKRDKKIKQTFATRGLQVKSFNGSLLWEPWSILKRDGSPYKVFSPYYYKNCLGTPSPRAPEGKPTQLKAVRADNSLSLQDLGLLPSSAHWPALMIKYWDISEAGAHSRLGNFIEGGLSGYKGGRHFPAEKYVSRLSPYLHFGQISPHQIWHSVKARGDNPDTDHFCSELGWREFSYYLLFHFRSLPEENFQPKFDAFPWVDNPEHLTAWQKGQTGIPIIDAGMRELWHTGFMHNRVRMIVASFLTKNLLIHWCEGARWFWDTLFDADLANNSASWQWVAGSGADAAPYFRIFNPVSQAEKFDPKGTYIKQWVPELEGLEGKALFAPWTAGPDLLSAAKIKLGETYPLPIVDLNVSRKKALEAYQTIRQA